MYLIWIVSKYISWKISRPLKPSAKYLSFVGFVRLCPVPEQYEESLSSLVRAFRKISPWTRFESTMLPASWVPTRSYPLQLPRSKLRGPTPTHRSIQLIPFGVETRTKSDPLHTYFKRGPGGTLEPSLRVVWDRAFSSSLARLSTSLLNLRNGVNRVSRGASQAVSRDPDVALAEFLEYSSTAVEQTPRLWCPGFT